MILRSDSELSCGHKDVYRGMNVHRYALEKLGMLDMQSYLFNGRGNAQLFSHPEGWGGYC